MKTENNILIGELARLAGVSADTVRYYERIGLLPRPQRGINGYRLYDAAAVSRLKFIHKAQAVGFPLNEVRRIVRLRDSGAAPCATVLAIARRRLDEIDARLTDLKTLRKLLLGYLRQWRDRAGSDAGEDARFCELIEAIPMPRRAPNRATFFTRHSS